MAQLVLARVLGTNQGDDEPARRGDPVAESRRRGLGLGLAALVHSFAQIDGESVALAQLLSRKSSRGQEVAGSVRNLGAEDEDDEAAPASGEAGPVEAFVPPQAWKDLAGGGPAQAGVSYV